MAKVQFTWGYKKAYDALPIPRDADTLFFILDSQTIYKGDEVAVRTSALFVDACPEFEDALEGVIYVVCSGEEVTLHVKDTSTSSMIPVGGGALKENAVSDIAMFDDAILKKADDELVEGDDSTIPTSGAVAAAIASKLDAKMTEVNPLVSVEATAQNDVAFKGTILKFKHADGTYTEDVKIADLFLTSSAYDPETHKLSLVVGDSDSPIEVDLTDLIPQAVSTTDVAVARNIVVTVDSGNFKKGDVIDISNVKTVQDMFEAMLSKDSLPTATNPSVTLTTANNKAYEVGTKVVPTFSATFSAGSYSQTAANDQVATGVTAGTWTVNCTGQESKTQEGGTTFTGSFDEITVEDDTDVAVTVSVTHNAGATPKSYLGKDSVDGTATSTKAIAAGTKSDNNNNHITGFRNCFWGYKTADKVIADPAAITVAQIKELGNTNKTKPSTLTATGMQQMFFAVPADQASKLTIMGANPPAPQTVQGPISLEIGGVDNYAPIAYNIFYVSNAGATSGTDTYTLTWSK